MVRFTCSNSVVVTYSITASNRCNPNNLFVSCTPPSGSSFALGNTVVNCVAIGSGQTNQCSFTVTVMRGPNCPPTNCVDIVCPTNIIAECMGPGGTVVDYTLIANNRCLPSNPVYTWCTPPPRSAFPVGTTVVQCTAISSVGSGRWETNRCSFTVTVRDTTPPLLTCPRNIILSSLQPWKVYWNTPSATDNCDSGVTVSCSPPSGSVFPFGSTPVTCTATDDSGNRSTCTFIVKLTRALPLVIRSIESARLELTWTDPERVLEQAPDIFGPWEAVPGASSPHVVAADGPRKFFRLRPAADGELMVASDVIAIIGEDGIKQSDLDPLVEPYKLKFDQELPGNTFVYNLPEPTDRETLAKLAREIRQKGGQLVKQSGLVVNPAGGADLPMILTDEFVAQFRPNVDPAQIAALNAANGVEVVKENPLWNNHYLLRVKPEAGDPIVLSRRYGQNPLVEYAEPNFLMFVDFRAYIPNDPLFAQQWHLNNTGMSGGTPDADIDAPEAWDITMGDPSVIIADLDGGFDVTHPDLIPNLWTNPGEIPGNGRDDDGNGFVDDINGWDFVNNDNTLAGGSHGTATAGCAAALGDNMLGVSGSCPNGRLMLIRNLGGFTTPMQDALAFDYARVHGADIITCSWGYVIGTPMTATVTTAINRAAALGRGGLGCVIFFAMNNANIDDCVGATPDISSLADVIAVSAASNQNRKVTESAFGNCMDVLGPTHRGYGTAVPYSGTLNIATTDVSGNAGYNNASPVGGAADRCVVESGDRNYTFCFGGTSAATPITAGIAGLILSVNPTLTRQQVQQLLQDTADKIEPGVGAYSAATGFSSPAGGIATHGYGRVNAFEAVRVAAPAPEGRGDVDIFLRDNVLDWGNTEQPSNVRMEPTRGFIAHYRSVDIKIDAPPFAPAPATAMAFEAFAHENPMEGVVNKVYVRVHNRGHQTAAAVTVKLHWAFAGAGLPALPADFWMRFPADSPDISHWHPLGVVTLHNLTYSGASVAGSGADSAQIAAFDFPAPAFDPGAPNPEHHCLFAVIDSPQDAVSAASRASLIPDVITPNDNNVTHKNVELQRSGRSETRFFIRNPYNYPIYTRVILDPPTFPIQVGGFVLNEPFLLAPGKDVLGYAFIGGAPSNWVGNVSLIQEILGEETNSILGGFTLEFPPILPGQPDLVVTSFQQNGATVLPNGFIEVSATAKVRNIGTAAAGIFKTSVEYTRAPDATEFTVAFTVLGQADIWYPWTSGPLAPGAEVTFSGKLTYHSALRGRTVQTRVWADSRSGDEFIPDWCRVLESNEGNNHSVVVPITLP